MNPHTDARPSVDASIALSASGQLDETVRGDPPTDGTASGGFGPAVAAGEVGTLGPYRIVKKLGKGGMGAVYAAVDMRLDRRLALKIMLPESAIDHEARERFLREARAAARVKQDHVVTVYEADERNGVPYIAMELLAGYSLDEYLNRKGNLSPEQVLKIAAETAAGLAAAHRQGLVHRDVKPANLWLEAPHGRVKLLDFGLVRPVTADAELTRSGALVGTPAYMSPEQACGLKVDHRTDLFSLGAVLYRLCTGRNPFAGEHVMAVLAAVLADEPTPIRKLNPKVPKPLAELIHQLLAKSADARPASADEVVKRVRAIRGQSAASPVVDAPIQVTAVPGASPFADLDVTEVGAVPVAESAPAAVRRKPRRPWGIVAAGLAALSLLAGVIIVIRNRDGSETKIEVPEGATVTVKEKDSKTLPQVGSGGNTPAVTGDPDRRAAEDVVSLGGGVMIEGQDREFKAAADLPKERFTLTTVNLRGTAVTDAGLANFKGCKGLQHLDLANTGLTDAGLANFEDCKGLLSLSLSGTAVTDAGLANFRSCKGLWNLDLQNTKVTDAGLANLKGCKGLQNLNLGSTGVTDAGLANFGDCKVLQSLWLFGTAVTDAGLAYFKGCKGLQSLFLDGQNQVTDAGLAHFKDCKGLTFIHVSGTAVTDAGLANFKDCEGLRALYLRGTGVTDAGMAYFKDCKGLGALDVGHTKVTDAGLAHFKDCKGLGTLTLPPAMTDAGLANFKDCKGLNSLELSGTQVTDAGLAYFKDCKGLVHLGLHMTKVTDAGLANFKDCKELISLYLYDTAVTDAGLANFKDCKKMSDLRLQNTAVTDAGLANFKGLWNLWLDNTQVTDAGLAHLKDCKGLQNLRLDSTGVTDAGLAHLKDCKGLQGLGLQDTQVTDAGLAHLKDCKGLRVLHLRGTAVTDAGLANFKDYKGLQFLTLQGAKVTAAGVADFHAAVPGCRIEHDGGVIEPKK